METVMSEKPARQTGTPDWLRFTARSDTRYKMALEGADGGDLAHHNLLSGGMRELRIAFDLARLYFKTVPEGGAALDLCCGAGYMSDCLRQFGFNTLGADLNADAIALAQKRYGENRYLEADVSRPDNFLSDESFNLILAREAHPFSRIGDFDFHLEMIRSYLSILEPGGLMIIAHARRGGGMDFPSIDYNRLKQRADLGVLMTGPFMPQLIKRFGPSLRSRAAVNALSAGARFYQTLTGTRLIEIFLLYKPV